MKPEHDADFRPELSRTPQGVRGLKLVGVLNVPIIHWSHSARSAWIETVSFTPSPNVGEVALRKECVD